MILQIERSENCIPRAPRNEMPETMSVSGVFDMCVSRTSKQSDVKSGKRCELLEAHRELRLVQTCNLAFIKLATERRELKAALLESTPK